MATPPVVDLELLLAPLPGENPCGQDLRWDPLYDRIRELRVSRDADALSDEMAKEADWEQVIALASQALATRSKHLMVAAWLVEALLMRHGFVGVRDGLKLVAGLLTNFPEGVYPLPDDDDLEPRLAPLVWLAEADRGGRLPNRLRESPLLQCDAGGLSWSYWKSRYAGPKGESEDDDAYQRRREDAEQRGKNWDEAVASLSLDAALALDEDIREALQALGELDRAAALAFDRLAPSVTGFRQALEECGVLVRQFVRDKGGAAPGAAEAADEAGAEPVAARNGAAAHGPIQSRDDAFRRLAEVASFLRRTEPQSPVPLLIDRAITWGRLPFDVLLREMIKDDAARRAVNELLGISDSGQD